MDTWTTRKLLTWTTQHFEAKAIDAPRVAAEMLLAHVLGVERLRLYMEPDRPTSPAERDTFRALVARAAKHEPVDYLIGRAPFFSLEFRVGPAVLVPRPSTETIVEHVLQHTRPPPPEVLTPPSEAVARHEPDPPTSELTYEPVTDAEAPQGSGTSVPVSPSAAPPGGHAGSPAWRIADVCTGSGAVAIALAKHLPGATFVATDLSEAALDLARQNAADHGVADRIDFRPGDLYAPLGDERFDYLLSNPPYISDAEWADVPPNVKDHEPTGALRSGPDGLDHLRPLIAEAHRYLLPGGQALFEFSSTQADAVLQLAADASGLANPAVLKDHEQFPRILVVDATP